MFLKIIFFIEYPLVVMDDNRKMSKLNKFHTVHTIRYNYSTTQLSTGGIEHKITTKWYINIWKKCYEYCLGFSLLDEMNTNENYYYNDHKMVLKDDDLVK